MLLRAGFLQLQGPLGAEQSLGADSVAGAWAQLPRGLWNLPRPGIQPVSPALAGRFLITGPPEKSNLVASKVTYKREYLHS